MGYDIVGYIGYFMFPCNGINKMLCKYFKKKFENKKLKNIIDEEEKLQFKMLEAYESGDDYYIEDIMNLIYDELKDWYNEVGKELYANRFCYFESCYGDRFFGIILAETCRYSKPKMIKFKLSKQEEKFLEDFNLVIDTKDISKDIYENIKVDESPKASTSDELISTPIKRYIGLGCCAVKHG